MVFKTNEKLKLAWLIAFLLPSFIGWKAFATEFNTDVLDADDMQNIDMSQFSVAGYTLPGDYVFTLFVNGQRLGAPRNISVYENKPIAGESTQATQTICIPPDILELIGLKRSAMEKVTLSHSGKCLDFSALSGVQTAIELSTLSLKMTIPQIWMEYRDPYWVPANLWEEGIGGAFIDYNANISATKETNSNRQIYLSSNGITGVNWGLGAYVVITVHLIRSNGVIILKKNITLILLVFMHLLH